MHSKYITIYIFRLDLSVKQRACFYLPIQFFKSVYCSVPIISRQPSSFFIQNHSVRIHVCIRIDLYVCSYIKSDKFWYLYEYYCQCTFFPTQYFEIPPFLWRFLYQYWILFLWFCVQDHGWYLLLKKRKFSCAVLFLLLFFQIGRHKPIVVKVMFSRQIIPLWPNTTLTLVGRQNSYFPL